MTPNLWTLTTLPLLLSACVFDADDRCGEHQVQQQSGACICENGYVLSKGVCEKSQNAGDDTGSPDSDDGGHADSGTGFGDTALGDSCKSGADCTSAFPYCREEPGAGVGYCTLQSCQKDSDCPGEFRCQKEVSPSFCKRPPTGAGAECTAQQDCQGLDAWACNTFQKVCVVIDCLKDPNASCFEGYTCCDFSAVGAPSLCLSQQELVGGECPF